MAQGGLELPTHLAALTAVAPCPDARSWRLSIVFRTGLPSAECLAWPAPRGFPAAGIVGLYANRVGWPDATMMVPAGALRIFTMVLRFEDHWACSSTVPTLILGYIVVCAKIHYLLAASATGLVLTKAPHEGSFSDQSERKNGAVLP